MNMKKLLCALAISAIAAPGLAFADGGTSCAAAQEIFSHSSYSGDTSTSTSFIGNFSGPPSPGPDLAFKFTAHNPAGAIHVTITGGWNAGGVITASCGPIAGGPISVGTGTTAFDVPLTGAGLVDGNLYYFIMTGNPADNSGPSGAFAFTTDTTPVTLKDFSID
jgi:hypothetical protein